MTVRVVIVGTGTNVGKTHVSACLLAAAKARGLRASAYKPVATGVGDFCEDAQAHAIALGRPYVAPTFSYKRPVSPHLAAREEGRPIDLDSIARRADELAADCDVALVETAGGMFTPLGERTTNATLVLRLLPARVLLVGPDRLGVLHDLGACVRAAHASGISFEGIVLSTAGRPDDSTGTNADEALRVGAANVICVFPRAEFDAEASLQAAAKAWSALGER